MTGLNKNYAADRARMVACFAMVTLAALILLTTVSGTGQAQTDNPFNRWLEARKLLVCNVYRRGNEEPYICVMAADAVNGYELTWPRNSISKQRIEDLEQFEKDKAHAAERGVSIEAVLKERLEMERSQRNIEAAKWEAKEEQKERKEAAFLLAVEGIIAFAVATVLYRYRRKIATNLSDRWRKRSKAFRVWAFASMCWAIGVFFYVLLAEPYKNDEMSGQQILLHMFSVMIVPPAFFGTVWFGYKHFVE